MPETDPSASEASATETFTAGRLFEPVFARGMMLVEETAAYLDGPGRDHSARLSGDAARLYTSWSMELTTRLMQAASWLVMHKAVHDGDMRAEEAAARKYRIRRDEPAIDPRIGQAQGLPPRFVELVTRSEALFEQVCRLDQALYPEAGPHRRGNTVTSQQAALRQAAEAGLFDPSDPDRPERD